MARQFSADTARSTFSLLPITRQRIIELMHDLDETSASAVIDMAVEQMWQREIGEAPRDVFAELDEIKAKLGMTNESKLS